MKHSPRLVFALVAAALALPMSVEAAKADRKNKNDATPPAFATVDKDNDGSVSKDEFVAAMKEKLGDDGAKARFATLDKDNNGKLSKEEYAAAAETKKRRKKNTN